MKRKISFLTKFSAIVLSVLICFSAVACGGGNDTNNSSVDTSPLGEVPTPDIGAGYNDTGKYIINDGLSDYKILIPEAVDKNIETALSELQYGIKLTTGYDMPSTDVYQTSGKYLSIGDTPLYRANKAAVDGSGIGERESRVLTVGDSVVMIGYDNEYTVYAVYDFMEFSMGFKWFAYDTPQVVENTSVKLFQIDYKYKAKSTFRNIFGEKFSTADKYYFVNCRRMRFNATEDEFYTEGHNIIDTLMPKSKFLEAHPEWYTVPTTSTDPYDGLGQLCLTNEEMIAQMIENVKEIIIEQDFSKKYFFIGMSDNYNKCMGRGDKCSCLELAAETAPNGDTEIRSGVFIIFMNKVARAVNQWIEEEHPDKEKIKFGMFAYYDNVSAPVELVNGKYVPTDERVIPDENVFIYYAPLKDDYTYSFGDERNAIINSTVKGWGALTKNFVFRSFGIAFGASEFPFNDLLNMGGTYQINFDYDFLGFVEEKSNNLSLARLKEYVSSQMWYGKGTNVDELAYEFIDFYYAPVAKEFKQYYDDLKQFQIHQIRDLGFTVALQSSTYAYSRYWPFYAVKHFEEQLDGILRRLEPLKQTDPEAYKVYFDRVNYEKIWVYYVLCYHYKSYFNDTDFIAMVDFLEKYVTEYQAQYSEAHLQQFRDWKAN